MNDAEDAAFRHRAMAVAAEAYLQRCRRETDGDERLAGVELIGTVPMDAPPDGGVLWLGGWCEARRRGSLDVVLPNPWDARDAIGVFEEGCWRLTQWLARAIAPRFNEIHGVELAPTYWDMLATPWLLHMVSVVTERYLRLATARQMAPGAPVAIGALADPPRNGSSAVDGFIDDHGNLDVCSRIALASGWPTSAYIASASTHAPKADAQSASKEHPAHLFRERALIRRALNVKVSRLVHGRHAGRELLLLAVPFASPFQVGKLRKGMSEVRAGSISEAAPPPSSPSRDIDRSARSSLTSGITTSGALEALLTQLLPDLVPQSLVEGYTDVARLSRARYGPPCPTVIGNYFVDEPQNEYLGRVAASGSPIAFAQHGGSYRQSRVDAIERLEVRDGGTFLSWGWEGPGARTAASPKLAKLRDTHRGGGGVLIVEVQLPRYVLRFNTWPLAEQTDKLTVDLGRFVEEASTRELAHHLLLKPATDNDSYGHSRSAAVGALRRTNNAISPYATDWMKNARLVVVTYPATSLIEAMVIGVPMIGLWDRSRWEERDDASEHFERLERLGILFADPAEAAERASSVYERATDWWLSSEIQRAREAFLQRFARTETWVADWRTALSALKAAGSQARASPPSLPARR